MSYARFGDGSDVYVFTSYNGIECCGCILQKMVVVEDPGAFLGWYLKPIGRIVKTVFRTNEGMIGHLRRHQRQGHTVPDYALARLADPADARSNKRFWKEHADKRGTDG